jgi:hypothetical protein
MQNANYAKVLSYNSTFLQLLYKIHVLTNPRNQQCDEKGPQLDPNSHQRAIMSSALILWYIFSKPGLRNQQTAFDRERFCKHARC